MTFQSYDAIVMPLGEDKTSGKADVLLRFIANCLFVMVTALLIDVLTVVGVLSLTFQQDSGNLSCIRQCPLNKGHTGSHEGWVYKSR